jgi:hypothetical protein
VNTPSQIAEAELLDAAKPSSELLPRHVEPECLGQEGLRDDALHREALGRSLRPLKPPLLQLHEFALSLFIGRPGLEQLHEEGIELLTKRRGSLLA